MPTNDERREVAEIMRYMARDTLSGYSFQRAVESVVFGQLGNKTWRQVLSRLADLIEPEPERTCRNLSKVDDVFVCSECQNETHGCMVDKFGFTVGFGKVVSSCPNCGRKVMHYANN